MKIAKNRKPKANQDEMAERIFKKHKENLRREALRIKKAEQAKKKKKKGNWKKKKSPNLSPARQKKKDALKRDKDQNYLQYQAERKATKAERVAYQKEMLDAKEIRQQIKPDRFRNEQQLSKYFQSEANCFAELKELIWPDGIPTCPHCKDKKTYTYKRKRVLRKGDPDNEISLPLYGCAKCRKQFTLTTGTMFSNLNMPLNEVFYLLMNENVSSKKLTLKEINRKISRSGKTALFHLHKIRAYAFTQEIFKIEEGSTVSIDTTAVFGKNMNRHDQFKLSKPEIYKRSAQVLTIKQNNGVTIMLLVPNLTRRTMEAIILAYVPKSCIVYTDEHKSFKNLYKLGYEHHTVNHSLGEHGRGKVSSNGSESVHGAFKPALDAHFNCFKKPYLQLFANAVVFEKNAENFKLTVEEKFLLSLQNLIHAGKQPKVKANDNTIIKTAFQKAKALTMYPPKFAKAA